MVDGFSLSVLDNIQMRDGVFTISTYDTRADWLMGRMDGIGASEAAAVCGKSPWMTEKELWQRKTGQFLEEDKGNADTQRGTLSESHIRELFGIEMGLEVWDGTGMLLRSTEHPFMTASLDGFYEEDGKPVVLEIKSVRRRGEEWADGCIPNHYLIQCLHQLIVTGWDKAVLRARFCSSPDYPKAYENSYVINREDYEDTIASLIKKEHHFWAYNVIQRKAPSVRMPSI